MTAVKRINTARLSMVSALQLREQAGRQSTQSDRRGKSRTSAKGERVNYHEGSCDPLDIAVGDYNYTDLLSGVMR